MSDNKDEEVERLQKEIEETANKLSDLWIRIDAYARGGQFPRSMAQALLRQHKCPGWTR